MDPRQDVILAEGRVVRLRVVEPRDYEHLRRIETSGTVIQTYRLRGKTPSPEAYAASLWNDTQVNLAICVPPTGQVVGNLACYGTSFRDRHAYISVLVAPWAQGPATFQAAELFLGYLFDTFDFRKVYAEVLEPNLDQFASLVGYLAKEEGRFVEDVKIGSTWHDRIVLAIWQRDFRARLQPENRRGVQLADALRTAAQNGSSSTQ
jgi:RimJ/RimL family protein N-acetyltransferase